jgi:hypothetical protein
VSCVDLTAEQQAVLDQLAFQDGLRPVDTELADAVATLREWGWIFGDCSRADRHLLVAHDREQQSRHPRPLRHKGTPHSSGLR